MQTFLRLYILSDACVCAFLSLAENPESLIKQIRASGMKVSAIYLSLSLSHSVIVAAVAVFRICLSG